MQDLSRKQSAPTPNITIHEFPSRELLDEIQDFQGAEADWNTTVFELSFPKNVFAVVRSINNKIIGISSIHELSPHSYWLGNVCVAKNERRKGLASVLVAAILNLASDKA